MKRDWVVADVPCEGPPCTPEHPTCEACVAGRLAMITDGFVTEGWAELSEFARESWRVEAADT